MGKNSAPARRQRAAGFKVSIPALLKQKRAASIECLDKVIHHYRLTNEAGGTVDYWAGTETWFIHGGDRGTGLEPALEALKTAPPKSPASRGESDLVTIFTDASFDHKSKAGGWAAWVKSNGAAGIYFNGALKGASAAMVAEMGALAHGLRSAVECGAVVEGTPVLLQSDCINALQLILSNCADIKNSTAAGGMAVTRLQTQRKPGKKPRPTPESLPALGYILELKKRMHLKLYVRHVKGHSKSDDARSFVNGECDRLARAAMRAQQKLIQEATNV